MGEPALRLLPVQSAPCEVGATWPSDAPRRRAGAHRVLCLGL